MKPLYIILFLICSLSGAGAAQQSTPPCYCSVPAYTLSDPDSTAGLYLAKQGYQIGNLIFPYGVQNEESYFFFTVQEAEDEWLRIQSDFSSGNIWIEPYRLATTTRYTGYTLYDSPYLNRKIITESDTSDIAMILSCCGEWAYVEIVRYDGSEGQRGWLAPQDQCANPFTTCP